MPSQKFARAPLWSALSLALGLAISSPSADAAGLGRLTVQSGLGQPLKAELEVNSIGPDELPTMQVKLAPLSAFRAANLDFNPALSSLRFALQKRADGSHYVRINSPQPVNEPYLDLMVELSWSTGRVIREYTVLLDPPSLRQQAEVVAPVAPPAPVAAAPARPAPAPATPAAEAATPAAAPAPAAATPKAVPAASQTYTVKPGDTLGRIASQNRLDGVSLDQMLVATFRQNPDAFAGGNMNRLKAGASLTIPSAADASAIPTTEARREVIAQSADFAQYKSRLAQSVTGAPPVAAAPPAAAAGGQVTARVEDKSAAAQPTGDQLKIAKADEKGAAAAAAAAAKADEAAAKARAVKEEQEKAEQLRRTNEALKKALEIQSKAGAQAQQQADQKAAPAPAPTAAAAPAEAPKAEAPKAEAPKVEAAPPAPPPAAKAAPAAAPKADQPSFVMDMLGNTTTQLGLAGIVALLAGLFGWSAYRKRKADATDRFKETGEGLQANSLFGATGGQSVDTGTSTFNSSFIPAASQLDSNEVDPVAEADVYIAYGREEQAEDILKEALRLQPDRNGVRLKLLEIYARRGDKAAFMAGAEDLKERTSATGEDWEKALRLGRTMDPDNPMFAGAPMTELARGPATAFRIDPDTAMPRSSTLSGAPTTGLDLTGLTANTAATTADTAASAPPLTRMVVDTRMSDSEMRNFDTKMPDTMPLKSPAAAAAVQGSQAAPTTQFRATLTGGESKNTLTSSPAAQASDFGSLDFDLGPTKMNFAPSTQMPVTKMDGLEETSSTPPSPAKPAAPSPEPSRVEPAVAEPAAAAIASAIGKIPDLDLAVPPAPAAAPSKPVVEPAVARVARPVVEEEALSRPTVIGLMKAPGVNTMMLSGLPEDAAARLTSNTEQATVPLIDFDLSAISIDAATKRGETEPGSALAQQMATKLDLARGYIDLGVKDGARELLDEVMRDGTREQRQAAVDLIKQIEG